MENQEFTPPPVQNPSSPKLVYVVVVLLVLVFGGIGGYLLGTKKTSAPAPTMTPKTTTEYPAATTSDETAGWKTYTNNKYGYSLQYPSDWVVKEKCFADPSTDATCLSSSDFEFDPADFGTSKGGQIRIDGKDPNIGLSPDSFCEATPTAPEKCEYYSIGGLSVVRRLSVPYAMMMGLIKDNKLSLVFHVKFNQASQDKTIKTFDQILSTFKFLPTSSPSQADETAGWKTYTNNVYKISFKYPTSAMFPDSSAVKEIDNLSGHYQIVINTAGLDFDLNIDTPDPGVNRYFLESTFKEFKLINGQQWSVLTNIGYCDAGSCGRPFVAFQTTKNNIRYVMVFYGTTDVTDLHFQILSTFRFD